MRDAPTFRKELKRSRCLGCFNAHPWFLFTAWVASNRKQQQPQAAAAPPGTKRVVGSTIPLLDMSETSSLGPGLGLIQSKATI